MRSIIAATLIMLGASGAAAQDCAGDLPPLCLQSFGAGSAALSPEASEAGCPARLQTYRDCIATVAAQQGLTPDGPPLTRAERGFLLAMEAELADNVGRLEAFVAEKMDVTGAAHVFDDEWPVLRTRFFNTTEHPAYFIAPPDWLARTQGFYDDVARFLARDETRLTFRRASDADLRRRKRAKEQLETLVALGRRQLLPEISAVVTK